MTKEMNNEEISQIIGNVIDVAVLFVVLCNNVKRANASETLLSTFATTMSERMRAKRYNLFCLQF